MSIDTILFNFFFSETFAETLPQLFVLLILLNTAFIDQGAYEGSGIIMSIFRLKLWISMLSSSFGMAKFLQLGPCQLIPQNKMGISMFLITIANFVGLWWTLWALPGAIGTYIYLTNPHHDFFGLFWKSFCILFLPKLILVTCKAFNHTKSYR